MATQATTQQTKYVRISLGGESYTVPRHGERAGEVMEDLHQRLGGKPTVEDVPDNEVPHGTTVPQVTLTEVTPTKKAQESAPAPKATPKKKNSDFEGNLFTDDEAKTRIEGQQAKLREAGFDVGEKKQFFATGTRMADIGYETQHERKAEHDKKMPLSGACSALKVLIEAEGRHDEVMSSRDIADNITVTDRVCVFGHALTEQAIRGLTGLIKAPSALGYLLGLRDRILREVVAGPAGSQAGIKGDNAMIADILRYECLRNADRSLKLRMRKDPKDIFAIVSPSYSPADAPAVVGMVLDALPKDTKGSFAYDAVSTQWELRAEAFTPTPVDEQAVGEPFQGYSSFQARDNGTSKFRGGGGVELIRCLNASVYSVDGATGSRIHRGEILIDIDAVVKKAAESIHILCEAWGQNRATEIPMPVVAGKKITIEDAIPGFYRYMLIDRRSELKAALPGRTEENVGRLTAAYFGERRDPKKLIRSDLAQGFTRAIQDFDDAPIRRKAEMAIGNWLVKSSARLECELRETEDES